MLDALTSPVLLAIFIAAAGAVWAAGIKLSDATDILEARFGLGQALGGMILLAIATNLPEIPTTVSASLSGRIGSATGNIFGGIAIQTLVLVVLDAVCLKGRAPLTFQAA